MNVLKNKEPKYLVPYLQKRLHSIDKSYGIFKSLRSPKRTYYLRSSKNKTVRISDHDLHENQYKASQIDIVIQEDKSVMINKIPIPPHEIHSYKSVIADYVLEIIKKKSS